MNPATPKWDPPSRASDSLFLKIPPLFSFLFYPNCSSTRSTIKRTIKQIPRRVGFLTHVEASSGSPLGQWSICFYLFPFLFCRRDSFHSGSIRTGRAERSCPHQRILQRPAGTPLATPAATLHISRQRRECPAAVGTDVPLSDRWYWSAERRRRCSC